MFKNRKLLKKVAVIISFVIVASMLLSIVVPYIV